MYSSIMSTSVHMQDPLACQELSVGFILQCSLTNSEGLLKMQSVLKCACKSKIFNQITNNKYLWVVMKHISGTVR